MKRKSIAGLIVIVAAVVAGCIEEEAPTTEIPSVASPEVTEPGEEPGITQPSEKVKQEITLERILIYPHFLKKTVKKSYNQRKLMEPIMIKKMRKLSSKTLKA